VQATILTQPIAVSATASALVIHQLFAVSGQNLVEERIEKAIMRVDLLSEIGKISEPPRIGAACLVPAQTTGLIEQGPASEATAKIVEVDQKIVPAFVRG
jgi:hypothetical protein